jgi:hypothetical protein
MVGVGALGFIFASKIASPLTLNLKERNRAKQLTCGSMATALYDSVSLTRFMISLPMCCLTDYVADASSL